MTGAEFSEVDLDLLADYVGGALDGTPDEAVVTALIEGHPGWRAAHRELTGGVAAVTAGLGRWGAEPEPMPADVVARLDAAFATIGDTAPAASPAAAISAPANSQPSSDVVSEAGDVLASAGADSAGVTGRGHRMEPGSDGAAPARHLVAVPDDGERPATARKRTRRLKWAAPVGIAAGVLAFVGVGIQQLGTDSADKVTSAAGSSADQGPPEAADTLALPAGPAQVGASGVDYSRESLSQVAARTMAAPAAGKDRAPRSAESGGSRGQASAPGPGVMANSDDPLGRLAPQEALLACIDAISQQNGAGPVTAEVVDYARFKGVPALVVQFTATNGTWVWAVGADCGMRGSGADRLDAVKVG